MDIGILEMCLDPQSHPPHSSNPRGCRIGLTQVDGHRPPRDVVLILEVTLLIVVLLWEMG
jgi:hypothetical protein